MCEKRERITNKEGGGGGAAAAAAAAAAGAEGEARPESSDYKLSISKSICPGLPIGCRLISR